MSTLTGNRVEFPKLDPCWLNAPSEDTPGFADVFVAISMALQSALREHLPSAYFENLDHFRDVQTAYSILVYQSSRVFRGKIRTDLTRDVMNPRTLAKLVRMSRGHLIQTLTQVEARLRDSGLEELATEYSRKQLRRIMKSVQRLRRSRRCLGILVRGEGALVDALVELGGLGALSTEEQKQKVARLKKKWTVELRRMYRGQDFQEFAPLLLDTATRTLRDYMATASTIESGRDAAGSVDVDPLAGNL